MPVTAEVPGQARVKLDASSVAGFMALLKLAVRTLVLSATALAPWAGNTAETVGAGRMSTPKPPKIGALPPPQPVSKTAVHSAARAGTKPRVFEEWIICSVY